jgi:hypothetical protein
LTFREGYVGWHRLNYICSTLGIENLIGASQEVRECLAVFAVTHGPIHAFWVANVAFEGAACALQWMVHG